MYFFYNIIMARFYDQTYDPQKDSGSSGVETSDLDPGQAYKIDLRRIDPEERESIDLKDKGNDVNKNIKAAKAANLYKQRSSIADPTIRGETPVGKAVIDGVELPSLRGRNYGPPGAGGTEYAHKPKGQFGKYFT